jgi:pyruvate dehydrogenase E1 component alpha subunit
MGTDPDYVALYRRMVLIRAFETRVHQLLSTGAIHGTSHLCAGQEAVAVGACAALSPDDLVVSNHRGHGHFLAKGGDPRRIMAELWGKVDGYSRGRGGSQHIACRKIGFLGSNGITGGGIPVATGAALAVRMRGLDSAVLCFFGDGAANQGTFHESLNMASLWELPVVYLCENNLYAMSTPLSESTSVTDIAHRAAGYGVPGRVVDGNDLLAVMDTVAGEVRRIRSGGGPALVECKTYRIHGHSRSDPCNYRPAEEEARWAERDPIPLFEQVLRDRGLMDESGATAIGKEQEAAVDDAVAFAEESALPDPAELEGAQYA